MMASTTPAYSPQKEDRRLQCRFRMGHEHLVYVACGSENGGILIDIAEGGLGFQGVGMLEHGQQFDLRLLLPSAAHALELRGEVVWLNSTGKGGGLRFVDMSDETRQQVKEWILGFNHSGNLSAHLEDASPIQEPVTPPDLASNHAFTAWQTPFSGTSDGVADLLASEPPPASGTPNGRRPIEKTPFLDSLRMSEATARPSIQKGRPVCNTPGVVAQRQLEVPHPDAEGRNEQSVCSTPFAAHRTGFSKDTTGPGMLPVTPQAILSDPSPGGFGAIKLLFSAALGCGIVLIALFGMRVVRGATETASSPLAFPAETQPGNVFHVQVVDGINPPWTLSIDKAIATSEVNDMPPASPPATQTSVAKPAETTIDKPEQVRASSLRPHAPHYWPLQMPTPTRPATSFGDSHAPPIADSALLAGGANLLTSHRPSAGADDMAGPIAPAFQPKASPRNTQSKPAVLVERVAPTYSPFALQQHVEGVVEVSVTIGKDGVPKALRVVHGDPLLVGSALAAIRRWRYRPALLDGKPVEAQTQVTVGFHLNP